MRTSMVGLFVLGVIAWGGTALAQEVVAEGLNNPMGVLAMPDGSVWVVDSGVGGDQEIETVDPNTGEMTTATVGMTSQVVRIGPDGQQSVRAMLPSVHVGQEFSGGSRLARLGTQVFVTSGVWLGELGPDPMPMMAAVVRVDGDEPRMVASTWDIEAASNPDGFVLESHPYGIVGGSDGNLYVADAGANTILRVNPRTGAVELVAVMDGVPSPMPNPARDGAQESDPVPTGITQTRDGGMYIASLPGFPFLPGSAGVHALSPDGSVTNVAGGLTMLTDLQAAPDGTLYAVTLAEFTEQGPTPGSGAVTRVGQDGSTEVVLEGLMFPTAIAFAQNGDAYLTVNGIGAPGSGMLVHYPGLGVR